MKIEKNKGIVVRILMMLTIIAVISLTAIKYIHTQKQEKINIIELGTDFVEEDMLRNMMGDLVQDSIDAREIVEAAVKIQFDLGRGFFTYYEYYHNPQYNFWKVIRHNPFDPTIEVSLSGVTGEVYSIKKLDE